jgi:ubiquinone/menaquinone biosynthesis C-methylase UbiE
MTLEPRKQREAEFHDRLRAMDRSNPAYEALTANFKFYAVTRRRTAYLHELIDRHCAGKDVLVYGSGEGGTAMRVACTARSVVGIDISPESVRISRDKAAQAGVTNATFEVMDCEAMSFPAHTFDRIVETGVLHHLDLAAAYREMYRVLRPDGMAICTEGLGHNPAIALYRRLTPHLRTEWEAQHILRARDIEAGRALFPEIEMRFFDLATLAAVPLRRTALFPAALTLCERIDAVLLRLPGIRWWAWSTVFTLHPKPNSST